MSTTPTMISPSISKTEQRIFNDSFDEEFQVLAIELVGYDGSVLRRLACDASGNLKIDPTLLDSRYLLLDQTTPQTVASGAPLFSVGLKAPKIYPSADSTTAIQFNKADGTTNVLNIDTTNARVGIGTTGPRGKLDVQESATQGFYTSAPASSTLALNFFNTSDSALYSRFNAYMHQFYTSTSTAAAGTEKMRLSSYGGLSLGNSYIGTDPGAGSMIISGNVGIGTTSPGAKLEVAGPDFPVSKFIRNLTGAVSTRYGTMFSKMKSTGDMSDGAGSTIFFANEDDAAVENVVAGIGAIRNGGDAYGALSFYTTISGLVGMTERMRLSAQGGLSLGPSYVGTNPGEASMIIQGNVGIGTTSPATKLEILKTGSSTSPAEASAHLLLRDTTQTYNRWGFRIGDSNGNLFFDTTYGGIDYNRVAFTRDGNVGIGTTGPLKQLHIQGTNAGAIVGLDSTHYGGLSWYDAVNKLSLTTYNHAYDLRFGNDWMTILSSGNVGIGTTSPTNLLSLGGNSARTFWMERHTTANTAGNTLTVQAGGATSGATDKAGGDLLLYPGVSTGSAESGIQLYGCVAGASGTADRTQTKAIQILGNKLAFYNVTPVTRPTALTAQLTTLTHTEPGTPDYAIQNLTNTSPYGFVTQDEGNSVLKVIANLQTRVSELETKLQSLGLLT